MGKAPKKIYPPQPKADPPRAETAYPPRAEDTTVSTAKMTRLSGQKTKSTASLRLQTYYQKTDKKTTHSSNNILAQKNDISEYRKNMSAAE
jgi:hypothetical protein